MSIVRRNTRGFCEHIDDDVAAHVPADAKTPVPRPPDLDIYQAALRDEWPVTQEGKVDAFARLHAVVKYVNDPRAVNKAAATMVKMTESNHHGREVALKSRETFKVPASMPLMKPRRKYDLEGSTDDQDT
jgi:hypothetical protein